MHMPFVQNVPFFSIMLCMVCGISSAMLSGRVAKWITVALSAVVAALSIVFAVIHPKNHPELPRKMDRGAFSLALLPQSRKITGSALSFKSSTTRLVKSSQPLLRWEFAIFSRTVSAAFNKSTPCRAQCSR